MKKKKKIVIAAIVIIAALVLLVPIPMHIKDGGSVKYKALLYEVTNYHMLAGIPESPGAAYVDGLEIKILGLTVYTDPEVKAFFAQGQAVPQVSASPSATGDTSKSPEASSSPEYVSQPMEQESAEMLKNGINNFAFEMYGELEEGENLFFSPFSICSALSVLNLGAGSDTKAELEKVLGIADFDIWNAAMQSYLHKTYSSDTYVTIANSLWLQEDKEWAENMRADFLKPAGEFYSATVEELNFRERPGEAIAKVNSWAEENTNGMIPRVIDHIDADTVMVLMNAVYFEGKWEIPFLEDDTVEATFHGTDGDVTTDLMYLWHERYAYIEMYGLKGVAIPYRNSDMVMKVFLPLEEEIQIPEDSSINYAYGIDVEGDFNALSAEEKQKLLDSLDIADKEELARLALPKFTMDYEVGGLVGILKNMGIESAFKVDADFDLIAEDVYVSEAMHKAKIEVDENGTKAAAITGLVGNAAAPPPPEQPKEFVADRPFVYVIQDTETGIILFMGRMNNPE